ncbi:MAG: alanine racemase [Bacillus sp. (in: Bacteria)]|nr:alanine racemase [Bacillus sp. (in: firmicutes)]
MKGNLTLEQLETPALVLDEKKYNRNLTRMMAVRENGVDVRPHFKTHKSVAIAKKQLVLGAVGITVATSTEAELLLDHGFNDILLAFPLTDETKIKRLFLKAKEKQARLILTVDSEEQGLIVKKAADQIRIEPELWIKINSGLNRCGVEPREEGVKLALFITEHKLGRLTGLYTHAGHSYAASSLKEIAQIADAEARAIIDTAEDCEKEGIPITHRSVGSTPTFERGAKFKGITEVRPGNAVFFDSMQVGLGVASFEETALYVLATVVSVKKGRFILDTGSKALTTEKGAHGNESVKGFGKLLDYEGLNVTRVSEEHGIVEVTEKTASILDTIQLNDRVRIVPNHACPVVNLFDNYYVHQENGELTKLPVDGRGKSQ